MYVYIRSEPGLWTVGHYRPDGRFEPESDHGECERAARRVHWLNGGRDEYTPDLRAGRRDTPADPDAVLTLACREGDHGHCGAAGGIDGCDCQCHLDGPDDVTEGDPL